MSDASYFGYKNQASFCHKMRGDLGQESTFVVVDTAKKGIKMLHQL